LPRDIGLRGATSWLGGRTATQSCASNAAGEHNRKISQRADLGGPDNVVFHSGIDRGIEEWDSADAAAACREVVTI